MASASGGSGASERKLARRFMKFVSAVKHRNICFIGDPSIDSHARFNLSPVPSVEDDEDSDNEIEQQTQRVLPNIDQDDIGEDAELMNGPPGSTTTVQMFDKNHGVSSPSTKKYNNQGFRKYFSIYIYTFYFYD